MIHPILLHEQFPKTAISPSGLDGMEDGVDGVDGMGPLAYMSAGGGAEVGGEGSTVGVRVGFLLLEVPGVGGIGSGGIVVESDFFEVAGIGQRAVITVIGMEGLERGSFGRLRRGHSGR